MSLTMLHVQEGALINADGFPIRLRGTCIGGWMNGENFIDGFPGSESSLRAIMAETLGATKAQFFFDRLLDYFLTEDDIAFIRSTGANVVRLPLNYRHFEQDRQPFRYLEAGFARLDQVLRWCAKHEVYAILDLHAVQGWQNTDWHSDNANRHSLFWTHPHFQERFIALWEEFARRYAGNAVIAGYNVMNEPVTNAPFGLFPAHYTPDYEALNAINRRVVDAIRAIDPDHVIFLEGDLFSVRFDGLEPPFAPNLVYSSHNYTPAGFGPGPYPGDFADGYWDKARQEATFLAHEGTRYTQQHHVPLWVGEFGSAYNGLAAENDDRLRALSDEIAVFEQYGAHWTTWTFKDVGVMGWVQLNPDSLYMRTIAPVIAAKKALHADFWMHWLPTTPTSQIVTQLARSLEHNAGISLDPVANEMFLRQNTLEVYGGGLLQQAYAACFKGMSEAQIDEVLQSFTFGRCVIHQGLIDLLQPFTNAESGSQLTRTHARGTN